MIDHRKRVAEARRGDSIGNRRNRNPSKEVSPIGARADKGAPGFAAA
jgi:hypothetical protein